MIFNTNKASLNARFAALQAVYYAGFSAAVGFCVPILQGFGWTELEIGFGITFMAVSCTIASPLWGALCDRARCMRLLIALAFSASAVILAVVPAFGHNKWLLTAALMLIGTSIQACLGLVDSLAQKLIRDGYELHYSKTRSLGSVSYAVFSVLVGFCMARFGLYVPPVTIALLIPVLVLILRSLPEPETAAKAERKNPVSLLKNRGYVLLTAACFLAMLSYCSVLTYLPVAISALGGDTGHIGVAFFMMAIVEMASMVLYSRARKRFSYRQLIAVSLFGIALRSLLVGLSPSIPLLYLAMTSQMLGYGLYVPATVEAVSSLVARSELSTAQLILGAATMSLGQIVANPIAGVLGSALGVKPMLVAFAFPAVLAGILWLGLSKKRIEATPGL